MLIELTYLLQTKFSWIWKERLTQTKLQRHRKGNGLQFKKEARYQHAKPLAALWNIKDRGWKIKVSTIGRQYKSEIRR